ncbi:MAG: MFS transporter, partial [Bosea sp. (in: a-proteobacteria)]|nr:MFS transporter [Bosea sp. (in: a-proteobacteria)]
FAVMAAIAALALVLALRFWPAGDADEIEHEHLALAPDHPHLAGAGRRHRHAFVIDREHPAWPNTGRAG